MKNYELSIVSRLPESEGKVLKPWSVDGLETIGVWGEEPFEVVFRNNTSEKVQIRLSVDGTDVLTGKEAHTSPTHDGMWVIDAWGSMALQAWPETDQRGRGFQFGRVGTSVAAHTHGNMSSRGIIAVAVFTEGYKPQKLEKNDRYFWHDAYFQGDVRLNSTKCSVEIHEDTAPAVGAGKEILQKIGSAKGLVQPKLDSVLRMKYMWWDDLKNTLVKQGFVASDKHPSGFPGDKERKLANLGTTPTMAAGTAVIQSQPVIQRFV
jgi:hypothetical protein